MSINYLVDNQELKDATRIFTKLGKGRIIGANGSIALDGYTVHLALSIFCSLKLASSTLSYVLLQLTQNLASLYKDRNVLVDWQRGQFVNLGFNSDFFCNLSHVSNIINPLMIFIFIFPYRYNL